MNAFNAFFGAEHVLTFHVIRPNNITGGGGASDGKTDLLNEIMCYGTNVRGFRFNWHANTQLAIFRHRRLAMFWGSQNEQYWLADMMQAQDGSVTGNSARTNGTNFKAGSLQITEAASVKPFCLIGA